MLSNTQKAAILHIEQYALERQADAQNAIENVCIMCDIPEEKLAAAIITIKNKASVALHFHPDRLDDNMKSVAASLLESGIYHFDVSTIGAAAADLKRHPENWKDRGTYEDCLQELKLLWHVLLRFGERIVG